MKYLFIVMGLFYGACASGQIDRIDHIYVNSPKSEELYNFFKTNLQLPVAWDFQNFGDFSSGAFSFGNVAIEFVKFKDTNETELAGIALQPHESAEKIVAVFDSIKVMHDSIEPFTFDLDNGLKDTAWETMSIKNILPDNINLFICDYKHRKGVYKRIKETSDSLALIHGGPLGITGVKEIVIGCKDVLVSSNKLSRLPGLIPGKNNLFKFESGPFIRLIKRDHPGIEKIVINVSSTTKAKEYLESKRILGNWSKKSVFINPQAKGGLMVELVNK